MLARDTVRIIEGMLTSLPYFSQKRRLVRAPTFRLMPRDEAILEAVCRYRMLERDQLERLFFISDPLQRTNTNRVRERLRLLYQHRYLERVIRPYYPGQGSAGPVYRLGVNGARLLAGRTGVPLQEFRYWGRGDDKDARRTQVRPEFLEHGLVLAETRIAIEQSARRLGALIECWRDDLELRQARDWDSVAVSAAGHSGTQRIPILPDSYFALVGPQGRAHFFLEIDRATETITATWQRKIIGYKQYVMGGQFHRRYGVPWPQTPLRILTLTTSVQRAENLRAAAERYGPPEASAMFLFASLPEVLQADALTAGVWLRATMANPVSLH
jgi:hypothetical protein